MRCSRTEWPGQAILDVGCGTGRLSIELARRGYVVTGLDVSAGMHREVRKHAAAAKVNVRWIEAVVCLFTVLNGCALVQKYKQADVEQRVFDPIALTEVS